ncbi:nuclear transport factor 2 family protein [Amycolatopsis sp. CA-230715]|uniref:nuclear transport factor 2 family protein n=1 Tax=Amycolatopsis sp. CA-230715 TaxID=2745196 RepID=UPI001C030152|nr:nuclear transport factor 2 family protein [Amycolatopsis sp. CA-230715]
MTTYLWDQWTALWNGELADGARILTDDFRIEFGAANLADADALRGPHEFTRFIGEFRARFANLRYRIDAGPFTGDGHVSGRWLADARDAADGPLRTVGGIDILLVSGEKISRAWSVTGTRLL